MVSRCVNLVLEYDVDVDSDEEEDEDEIESILATQQEQLIIKINAFLASEDAFVRID